MGRAAPSIPDLAAVPLVIARVRLAGFLRIYKAALPNPLGYGKSASRFSDPRPIAPSRRFGVVYMNDTLRGCFVEAVLRERAAGSSGTFIIDESEIVALNLVEVSSRRELRLVDLRGDGLVRMRIPTDAARASAQALGRACSLAFYRHPERPDGIIFHSRLNGTVNVAVYGRAVAALKPGNPIALKDAAGFAEVLDTFNVGIARP